MGGCITSALTGASRWRWWVRSWGLSAAEQDEVWARWRRGESLRLIAAGWADAGRRSAPLCSRPAGCNASHRVARSGLSPWANAKRSAAVSPPASRAGRSRPGWDEPHQRCRGRWPETAAATTTGPKPPTPRPSVGPSARSLPSWCCNHGCGRWSRPSWRCGGRRSRSPGGCRWLILRIRCCGCRTRPSICRCCAEPRRAPS
jgi:hypothetical protein